MKKYSQFHICLFLFSFILFACGKQENPPKEIQIFGIWSKVKQQFIRINNNKIIEDTVSYTSINDSLYLELFNDSTYRIKYYTSEDSGNFRGKYYRNKSSITLIPFDSPTNTDVYQELHLSETELWIKKTDPDNSSPNRIEIIQYFVKK
jgi:hypothetical protein